MRPRREDQPALGAAVAPDQPGIGFLVLTVFALRGPATEPKPGWSGATAAPSAG